MVIFLQDAKFQILKVTVHHKIHMKKYPMLSNPFLGRSYISNHFIRIKAQQKGRFRLRNLLHISTIWQEQKMGLRRISRLDYITCLNLSHQVDENVCSLHRDFYVYICMPVKVNDITKKRVVIEIWVEIIFYYKSFSMKTHTNNISNHILHYLNSEYFLPI